MHQQHIILTQFGFSDRAVAAAPNLSRVINADDDQAGEVTARRFDRGPLESRPEDRSATTVVVNHSAGTQYVASVRGHEVRVDQALDGGGTDEAPSPVELFVVSLATCVAYFAGQYLERHGVDRAGLAVHAEYRKTNRPPARVASISPRVIVPAGLPVGLMKPLHAVVSHCTVHTRCENHQPSRSRSTVNPRFGA